MTSQKAKHDHRLSLWAIGGGSYLWCYRCGAIRVNATESKWIRPTGSQGKNPAMREYRK